MFWIIFVVIVVVFVWLSIVWWNDRQKLDRQIQSWNNEDWLEDFRRNTGYKVNK